MSSRACGSECVYPDEPHVPATIDWIGDYPLMHGERDTAEADAPTYCLCGHPNYLTCFGEGVLTCVVGDPYGGKL